MQIMTDPKGNVVITPTKTEHDRWKRVVRDMQTIGKFVERAEAVGEVLQDICDHFQPSVKKK